MQFIPILPIKHLAVGHGKYQLSLAHMYANKVYADHFRRLHQRGCYVIMDNSAFELPKPYTVEELWSRVIHYGASELVLPDVLKDPYATGQATREALEFLAEQLKNPTQRRFLRQVMIVPQGKDILEWIMSLDDLLSALETYLPGFPFTIGIAKHTSSYEGGRLKILDYLVKNQTSFRSRFWEVHLLGINEPLEELRVLGLAFGNIVRSIDSARPAIYANVGHVCQLDTELPKVSRPENFFDLDLRTQRLGLGYLRRNVRTYYSLLKTESEPTWDNLRFSC